MADDRLHLKVVTRTRTLVDQPVDEVEVPGSLGALGILPGHAPLLSGLGVGRFTWRDGSQRQVAVLSGGFVEVASDRVTVLADLVESPGEIDVSAARREQAEAEEALKTAAAAEVDVQRRKLLLAAARQEVAAEA